MTASGSSSLDAAAGHQYRRNSSPHGVPRPTRVTWSLTSFGSMPLDLLVLVRARQDHRLHFAKFGHGLQRFGYLAQTVAAGDQLFERKLPPGRQEVDGLVEVP